MIFFWPPFFLTSMLLFWQNFMDSSNTLSCYIRVHRAGSQLKSLCKRSGDSKYTVTYIMYMTAWQIDFWGLKKTSLNWSGIPETIFTRKFFLELRMNVVLKKFDFHNHWKIISGPYISICPKTWSLSPYQKLCHLGRRWIDYRNYKELLPKINI